MKLLNSLLIGACLLSTTACNKKEAMALPDKGTFYSYGLNAEIQTEVALDYDAKQQLVVHGFEVLNPQQKNRGAVRCKIYPKFMSSKDKMLQSTIFCKNLDAYDRAIVNSEIYVSPRAPNHRRIAITIATIKEIYLFNTE
jgi:hypothetical protein